MKHVILVLAVLLTCAVPARAQSEGPLLHTALASFMTLEGADLAMTMYDIGGQQRAGVREANPIFAPFVSHPVAAGAFKMGTAAAASWFLLKNHEQHPRLTFWIAIAADVGYAAVVAHNARLTR
jgi:hypothetical protein